MFRPILTNDESMFNRNLVRSLPTRAVRGINALQATMTGSGRLERGMRSTEHGEYSSHLLVP